MEVVARGGHRGVAERGLYEVDGCASVEAVARMRVTEPVGRDLGGEPGAFGFGSDAAIP